VIGRTDGQEARFNGHSRLGASMPSWAHEIHAGSLPPEMTTMPKFLIEREIPGASRLTWSS
jgi:hypothetical protein